MFHSESHLSAKGKGGIGSTLKITQNGSRGLAVFLHIFPWLLRASAFSVRYPDLNRNHPRPVFAAGPHPPSSQRRYVGTNVRKNVRRYISERTAEKMSERMSEGKSDRLSEQMSEDVPERMSEAVPERISGRMSEVRLSRRYVRKNVRKIVRMNVRR